VVDGYGLFILDKKLKKCLDGLCPDRSQQRDAADFIMSIWYCWHQRQFKITSVTGEVDSLSQISKTAAVNVSWRILTYKITTQAGNQSSELVT